MKLDNGWLVNSVYSYTKDNSILSGVKLYRLEHMIMARLYSMDTLDTEALEDEVGKWVVNKLAVARRGNKYLNYGLLAEWVISNALKHKTVYNVEVMDSNTLNYHIDNDNTTQVDSSDYWENEDIAKVLIQLKKQPTNLFRQHNSADKAFNVITGKQPRITEKEIQRLEKAVKESNSIMTKEHEQLVDRKTVAMGMLDMISLSDYEGLKELWYVTLRKDNWFNEVVAVPSLARDWDKQNVTRVGMVEDLETIVSDNTNEDY